MMTLLMSDMIAPFHMGATLPRARLTYSLALADCVAKRSRVSPAVTGQMTQRHDARRPQ